MQINSMQINKMWDKCRNWANSKNKSETDAKVYNKIIQTILLRVNNFANSYLKKTDRNTVIPRQIKAYVHCIMHKEMKYLEISGMMSVGG